MADINSLSTTDASNTTRFSENQNPSTVNDGARALEGMIARWHKDNNGSLATGGTSTAITVTLNQSSIAAWYDGLTFAARITTTCGATPTIEPTGSVALGAKSLYWSGTGTQLAASDLTSTAVAWFMYEATSDKVYVFAAPPTQTITGGDGITVTSGDIDFAPSELSDVALATGDQVVIADASDSNLPKAATASDFQSLFAAAASDMETGTSTTLNVTPGVQHRHPGHPKAWGFITMSGATPTLAASYGVTSITDTNTGRVTVNLSITLSSANYAVIVSLDQDDTQRLIAGVVSKGTTSFEIKLFSTGGTLSDSYTAVQFALFGDI